MTDTSARDLTAPSDNHRMVVPVDAQKDHKHRLTRFAAWLDATGRNWTQPDLAAYRDYLLTERGTSLSSVAAHLSTVRGRYRSLLRDNAVRDYLYTQPPATISPADRKAFVDEVIRRIENAVHPDQSAVKVITRQDQPDSDHIRLTSKQANTLLKAPGVDTLVGLRDTAVIAMMLCTGIREAELCALDASDLRHRLGGALALHIREGKGCKERLVPYGELEWALAIVTAYLRQGGISDGAVFRSFYRGSAYPSPNRLSVRAVQNILHRYPITIEGERLSIKPHDLRRTYARRLYETGVDLVAIQQNLGHADTKTTLRYIGMLDADARKPPAVYSFDLATLP